MDSHADRSINCSVKVISLMLVFLRYPQIYYTLLLLLLILILLLLIIIIIKIKRKSNTLKKSRKMVIK